MKRRSMLTILSMAVALFASILIGVVWQNQSFIALGGLREAGPYPRETEIAFIRSRVAHPLISPEWITGEGDDLEWRWSKSEMRARLALPVFTCIAAVCIVSVTLNKKCPAKRV
jgi:hypothetical protein